jgi:phasin family protein
MAARKTTAGKKPSRTPVAAAKETMAAAKPAMAEPAVAQEAAAVQDETHSDPVVHVKAEVKKPEPKKPEPKQPKAAPAIPAATGYPDLADLGRENLVAVARANAALVKGFEELGQEVAGYAQHNLVSAVDAARALVGIKTIADLVALNRKVAQETLEGALANSARLSEIGIRVATEALLPLNERVAQTFGRLGRPAG